MKKKEIKISSDFKTQTTKAIFSIVFFILVYLLMLILAVGLTTLCIYGGIILIAIRPMFITIALGVGLSSLGVLVLIFLLKFIFKASKIDRSHLLEIKKEDEPKLFDLIEKIVMEVGTTFPKKIYLSSDVNAAVFYDSSFWSMFLPVQKNLQIGLGLVNTISKSELTAILSHEFGHFSQKSMKVGSYIYNVNKIIFNLLYENESYDNLIQRLANVSGYFSIFVVLAVKIIEGIQWLLRRIYEIVNKTYMGMSREMEFHADEIAASVTGFEPLKNSLLRMSIADHSFNYVLSFYEGRINSNQKSSNLYKEQSFVLRFLAENNDIKIENGFPKITAEELNKFNKSKLVIVDQWASHPSTEDRIEMLEKTGILSEDIEYTPANKIFNHIDEIQKNLTNKIFKDVQYQEEIRFIPLEEFKIEYEKEFLNNSFSRVYNGYYDNKNPIYFDIDTNQVINNVVKIDDVFSDNMVALVYTAIALKNDIDTISQIAEKQIPIKTFDYDGVKYKNKHCGKLIDSLESELEVINNQIKENDIGIFNFFKQCDQNQNNKYKLEKLYEDFFSYDEEYDSKNEIFTKLSNALQFVSVITPLDQIREKFIAIKKTELKLKKAIKELLTDDKYKTEVTKEIKDNFDLYLSKEWTYFENEKYIDSNLEIIFTALNNYTFILSRGYFILKKELLDYQYQIFQNAI